MANPKKAKSKLKPKPKATPKPKPTPKPVDEPKEDETKIGADEPPEPPVDDTPPADEKVGQGEPPKVDETRITPPNDEEFDSQDDFEAKYPDGDYLRQYQYRKQTVFGSKASNPVKDGKAEKMKKHLLAQPRIAFAIHREQGESRTILKSVTLNGYRLDFPKNQYIEFPKQIAELLMQSLDDTEAAILKGQIDREKKKDGTTYGEALG